MGSGLLEAHHFVLADFASLLDVEVAIACAQIFTPIPILFKALLAIGERRARRGEHVHAGVSTRYVKDVLKKAAQLGLAVQKVIVEVADTGVHGVNGSSQHVVLLEAMLLRPEKAWLAHR